MNEQVEAIQNLIDANKSADNDQLRDAVADAIEVMAQALLICSGCGGDAEEDICNC